MVLMHEMIRKMFGNNKEWLLNRLLFWETIVFEYLLPDDLEKPFHLFVCQSQLWRVGNSIACVSKHLGEVLITGVKRKQNCF